MDGVRMNKIDGNQLRSKLEKLMPHCSLDEDNEGQVIIYTNLKETTNGNYKELK
jgi:hypothetical protein